MDQTKKCIKCLIEKPLKIFDNRKICSACRYIKRKEYLHGYYKKTYVPTPRIKKIKDIENNKPKRKYIKKIKLIENN